MVILVVCIREKPWRAGTLGHTHHGNCSEVMKQSLQRFVEWFGNFVVIPLALAHTSGNCGDMAGSVAYPDVFDCV